MLARVFAWKTVIIFMLHALCNQTSYDLIAGQLAGPIDLLAKRRQAELHAGVASVQQNAGRGEFSGSLLFAERRQIILRQLTQAVSQKHNIGILKASVHELERFIQWSFEIRAAAQKRLGGVHPILHGILTGPKNVHPALRRTGKMNERTFAPVFCSNIQQGGRFFARSVFRAG